MNNPNPFVPKGSLLEQQNKRRTHMKVGVSIVLAVSVVGLMGMLIQGCKQKSSDEPSGGNGIDTNSVPTANDAGTNTAPMDLSNQPPVMNTNTAVVTPPLPGTPGAPTGQSPIVTPPIATQPPSITPVATDAGGADYVIVKGDTLGKIAKKNGVTLKALEAANPDVKPTKLKLGQKLVIPAGGKSATDMTAGTGAAPTADSTGETYTVKSGDTLTKIAKTHHVKLKALQAANDLTTTKIKVGQKLKIPAKGEVAPAEAAATTPTVDASAMPAPPVPMVGTSPAASPSPAPAH